MFVVKWIVQGEEDTFLRTENLTYEGLEEVFANCQGRLLGGAMKTLRPEPDGFIICDTNDRALRRFVGKLPRSNRSA
jgi:hypothetical protein